MLAGESLTLIDLEDGPKDDARVATELPLTGACFGGSTLLTVSGHLLDAETGTVVDELPALEKCCRVAVRPDGGHVGLSKTETVRVWKA